MGRAVAALRAIGGRRAKGRRPAKCGRPAKAAALRAKRRRPAKRGRVAKGAKAVRAAGLRAEALLPELLRRRRPEAWRLAEVWRRLAERLLLLLLRLAAKVGRALAGRGWRLAARRAAEGRRLAEGRKALRAGGRLLLALLRAAGL